MTIFFENCICILLQFAPQGFSADKVMPLTKHRYIKALEMRQFLVKIVQCGEGGKRSSVSASKAFRACVITRLSENDHSSI